MNEFARVGKDNPNDKDQPFAPEGNLYQGSPDNENHLSLDVPNAFLSLQGNDPSYTIKMPKEILDSKNYETQPTTLD